MMLPLRLAHREVNRQEFEPHRLRNTMDRNINIKINIKKRREKRIIHIYTSMQSRTGTCERFAVVNFRFWTRCPKDIRQGGQQ